MPSHLSVSRFIVGALSAVCAMACGGEVAASARHLLAVQQSLGGQEAPVGWVRIAMQAEALAVDLTPVSAAFAYLPIRTILVLSTLVENDIAYGEAGQISRQDTLWLQAGSDADGMSYLDGTNLAPPKWNGAFPSIDGPLPTQADQNRPDSDRFTFQIGR